MQYVIDDTPIIEADVLVKQPPLISSEVLVPIKVEPVRPNMVEFGTPVVTNIGSTSFDVEQTFSSDVDYYGGIYVGESADNNDDTTLVKNPDYLNKTITGLRRSTTYYVNGVALPVMGNINLGQQITVTTKASPIPDEYQLVEYIESTGTQWIDVGELIDKNTSLEIEYDIKVTGRNVIQYTGGNFYAIMSALANNTYGILNSSGVQTGNRDIVKTVSSAGVTKLFVNGLQVLSSTESGTHYNIRIGIFRLGQDNYSWGSGNLMSAELYHYKLTKNDTIVVDMYPVYRKNDDKPGMYDIINNEFHTNQGASEFIVGPDKEGEE